MKLSARAGSIALLGTALAVAGATYLVDPGVVRSNVPPVTSSQDARGHIGAVAGDWAAPKSSAAADADRIVSSADVDAGDRVRVVTARLDAATGRPVLTVTTATGPQAAAATIEDAQEDPDLLSVSVDTKVTAEGGDPDRGRQWALDALDAEDVWPHASGSGAVVAVIDTGVAGSHPDLAGQVLRGAEFLNGNGSASSGDGRVDPHGHGTHVAGIIGAVKGNGIGIAGLAPTARILPIRALAADGSGWNSDIAAGIIYAADSGADVINMSLGGPARDSTTQTAVEYAASRGVIVVAAAGNNRQKGNQTQYPGAYEQVIAVASTDVNGASSSFSNTGPYVDVAAPGGGIYSTYPGGYTLMSGTSMATPYVAATAALAVDATNGDLDADRFAATLTATATDLGARGRDDMYGAGLISPFKTTCTFLLCGGMGPTDPPADPEDPTTDPEDPAEPPAEPEEPGVVAQPSRISFTDGGGGTYAGSRRTVTVKVTNPFTGEPLRGRTVTITAHRKGASDLSRTLTTSRKGRASWTLRIQRTTRFTAEVEASRDTEADTATYPIRWRAIPRMSIRYYADTATVDLNRPRGQRVLFQVSDGTRWDTRRKVRPAGNGVAKVRNLPRGIWRVRITPAGGQAPAVSGTWVVR